MAEPLLTMPSLNPVIVVPHYVSSQVDLPHRVYIAKDSMICNFA
jgi:hypothetical protein